MNSFNSSAFQILLLDFLGTIYKCYKETGFVDDRHLFANDIVSVSGWLVRLHSGESSVTIARDIIDSSTTKHFTDYWKQGGWGDLEANALQALQKEIRDRYIG